MELVAQILGYIITFICIFNTQLKKKWQMLVGSLIANFLNIPMFFILNGVTSAVTISVVAVAQCGINAVLDYHGKQPSVRQKIIFTILYFVGGMLQFKTALDLFPVVGSMLFMCGGFQKNAQRMRVFGLLNALVWVVYDCIIGTTAVYAQIFSLISVIVALYRYRAKQQ